LATATLALSILLLQLPQLLFILERGREREIELRGDSERVYVMGG
jgi:hypothetical protein